MFHICSGLPSQGPQVHHNLATVHPFIARLPIGQSALSLKRSLRRRRIARDCHSKYLIALNNYGSFNYGSLSWAKNIFCGSLSQAKKCFLVRFLFPVIKLVKPKIVLFFLSLYLNSSLHLARKRARIFVCGHYLFRDATKGEVQGKQ